MTLADGRQEANRKLIAHLSAVVEAHPDLRFGQILMSYGFVTTLTVSDQFSSKTSVNDPFNEEPVLTLKRVEKVMAMLKRRNNRT